ncbi:MAG: TIM-barrel domain-containing protein [Gemmatimonadales bacterium]|jgi:alpha-D-xyloside xylohydrolase
MSPLLCAFLLALRPAAPAAPPSDGVVIPVAGGFLKIEVVAADVIRVAFAPDSAFFARRSLAAGDRTREAVPWKVVRVGGETRIETGRLSVRVSRAGAVAFYDKRGRRIAAEAPGGRELTPADVQGERTYHVRQVWQANPGEALYGLGQRQEGLMDLKGYDLDLWQRNTSEVVPVLVSSRGYGIFWDNTSFTRFGDLRQFEPIPAAQLLDRDGRPGGLTGTFYAGAALGSAVGTRVDSAILFATPSDKTDPAVRLHPALPARGPVSARWEGWIAPRAAGTYQIELFANEAVKLWVDGKLVVDDWRSWWLPWRGVARVRLEAGRRYRVRLEYTDVEGEGETVQLRWKTPAPTRNTSLWSEVGDGVDYYFFYGPELDRVIAGYRLVTGRAAMPPRYAFGYWQSRNRYEKQQQSLDAVDEFRRLRIPLDVIVQDFMYWRPDQWGSHEADPARFPDAPGWIRAIHDRHARLLISVWGKFYPDTRNAEEMQARGFLYQVPLRDSVKDWLGYRYTFYDAFNPAARRLFWDQLRPALFDKGVDAWWLDATEPDILPSWDLAAQREAINPTFLGSGARMLNAYSLEQVGGIYEGQREAAPEKRVAILTRSAFAGLQRYGAAIWSGDIASAWPAMRKQIAAGLGFSISGIPYWSMDIGGYWPQPRFRAEPMAAADAEEWRELSARWTEFGAMVPIFRAHGETPPAREIPRFGDSTAAYGAMVYWDRLRYRLLPYIYSVAGAVTGDGSTMMRPLVMDFPADARARKVADQYLFGPALLVNPVTEYRVRSRSVYLPRGAWYDFWTGKRLAGGRTVQAAAPYDRIPVYVRAGSILPMGPDLQYTDEKPADSITLVVYTGANGRFSLYEDDGASYGYERGESARIPLRWDERSRTLIVGRREGAFPGMLARRSFQVVFVSPGRPVGFGFDLRPDRTVSYVGEELRIRAP